MALGNMSDNIDVDSLVGRVVADRYRVVEFVSAGANTIVCAAIDTESSEPVTVKIVQPDLAVSEGFRREFLQRAQFSATSLVHPNVARVLDYGEVSIDGVSTVYWAVEYLGGGSLRDLLDRGRLLDASQVLVVGLEATRALEAAHLRGVAHTEITPSKLVFGADRRLRITDFGMAELFGREAWAEPARVATHVARYASPEQALGLDADPKSDVYALAISLLESVTGVVPFASDSTVSTLSARVGKLMPVSADLGSLAAVLERAGRPEAEDRFTASEFGQALVQAAGRLPRPEPVPVIVTTIFDNVEPPADEDDDDLVDGEDLELVDDVVVDEVVLEEIAVDEVVLDDVAVDEVVLDEVAVDDVALDDVALDDVVPEEAAVGDGDVPEQLDVEPPADDEGSDVAVAATVAAVAGAGGAAVVAGVSASATVTEPVTPTPVTPEPTTAVPVTATPAAPAEAVEPTVQMPVTPPPPVGVGELYDDENPGRRKGPLVALGIFLLLGFTAVAFAAFYLLRTKSYEVPDLVGTEEAVALNEISGNDWNVRIENERSDEVSTPGDVIRTFPEAGAVLDEGSDFTMYVSEGPEFRDLPDVAGLTQQAAAAELEALQLQSFVDAEEFDEAAEAGIVLAWRVVGAEGSGVGDPVLPGTNIALTVSKGPAPRPVPDVTGLTLDEATAAAADVGLAIAQGDDVFSDDVPVGVIVSQDPAAGTEVARDSTFTVAASKGPDLVALPSLDGLTYAEAQQALTDAGFTIGSLLGTTDGTFESLSIDAEPIGDNMYKRGTSVDLIFL